MLAAALVGGLVFLAPGKPVPAAKQAQVAEKAKPAQRPAAQKSGGPSARTHTIPRIRPIAPIATPDRKKQKRKASLPSCASVRAQYNSMTWSQRMAAYAVATPEQVAHGRRCLGQ